MQSIMLQSMNQRLTDVFLTDKLGKVAGTPFSGKNLISH
jgi:hypothetical protein